MKPAAIIYDFDGTLARGNIQEHTFIPSLNVEARDFWERANAEAEKHDADQILTYMREMLLQAQANDQCVTRDSLMAHGAHVPFFEGVESWFERMNLYAEKNGLKLQHYVVSSGIRQMIRGCSIARHFSQIYASSFLYDDEGVAVWPALSINYTNKTQYLFRINKGVENCWDNKAVNTWIPTAERPLPFENMVFVGDGETDIPSMKMVRHQGGFAVAVFDPQRWESLQKRIYGLIAEDRANFVAPADYREGSQLDVTVRGLLGRIAMRG